MSMLASRGRASGVPADKSQWIVDGHIMARIEDIGHGSVAYSTLCWADSGYVHQGFVRLYDGTFPICPLCATVYEDQRR